MPTYVYECQSCKERVELVQKMSEKTAPDCQKCAVKMESVITQTTFVLKGSCWAKDGYK